MSKKFESDTPTIEEIRRVKKPNERSISLVLNPELLRQMKDLERAYLREQRMDQKENRAPKAPRIKKTMEALEEEAAEYEVTFIFRDIGRKRFDDMIEEHPPTEQEKKLDPPFQYHPDIFAPALMAATAVQPTMTLQQATDIYDEFGQGEITALFMTALAACTERASVPFTRTDTDEILASLSSLTSAVSEESPTDDS